MASAPERPPGPPLAGRSGTLGRRLLATLAILVAALCVLWLVFAQAADPALFPPHPGAPAISVHVVDHGYHAGLIVPVARLAEVATRRGFAGARSTMERIAEHRYAEIGWGDEGFYRQVPTIDRIDWSLAVAALTNVSRPPVLHVVGFDAEPRVAFPRSAVLHLRLSETGFERLVESYEAAIVTTAQGEALDLGPGLYGDSTFYRAHGLYNGLDDCNHWVARRLAAAGVPASTLTASLSFGLMTELRWRAGAD